MHLLSRFGRGTSAAILLLAKQGVSQTIPSPNLDLSSLGQVALAGNFDAISVYTSQGQRAGHTDDGTQSILSQLSNGQYDTLSSTDASIYAMCSFVMKNGTFGGVVVGGNFTSIGGVDTRSVALFNPNTSSITPLSGIQGTVSALYCDQTTNTVYVGGSFEAAGSSNAIAWVADSGWANLPFAGFDAPVTSITKIANGHIVFGGSFTGLGNVSTTDSQTNQTSQVINLSGANVTTRGNTTTPGFGDPRNILCPSNGTSSASTTWLLADRTPGSWSADLKYGFEPSQLRLWNTNQDGRGTKTWRFTAHPINGIMNMTYTDPGTGEDVYCDATCPLAQNTSFQDFRFVNTVGMNSFTIDVSDWYGNGGGLDGIELFQNDIFAYAIDAIEEPVCTGSDFTSTATSTGPWSSMPSNVSNSDYLTAIVNPATANTVSVVFEPDVTESGNYSIIVYTTGCQQDNTCANRGIVNITGTLTSDGQQTFSTTLYQTNLFDKYDQVYQGLADATASTFRPSVTITAAGLQQGQVVVASRVRFGQRSTTGGLNGLFDFDPNQAVVDMDFSKSAINTAGTMLNPGAHVSALAVHDDTLYSAGQFSDHVFENIMAFSNNNATSLPEGGLNAAVTAMFSQDDFLYLGGNFSDTSVGGVQGLSNVAAYQYSKNAWIALGEGLNGPIDSVVPMQLNISGNTPETVIAFSGSFSQILSSSSPVSVNGLAIWVPSRSAWYQALDIERHMLAGQLMSHAFLPNNTWLGAGTLASMGIAISGAAGLNSASGAISLERLPVNIQATQAQSSLTKRALTSEQNVTGVATGVYYDNSGRNVTVFGGHFSATATSGQTVQNLMFLNGSHDNVVTGLPEGIDNNSTFLALAVQSDLLFAGGSVTGRIDSAQVDGLVIYDLQSATYRDTQPAALAGSNVIVNSIATQPGTTMVYVGGSFDGTSQSLSCPSVCMYDTSMNQWNPVGSGVDGTVSALYWSSDTKLLAAGDLTIGGNRTTLATYDTKQQTWTTMSTSAIPGPVTVFAPGTSDSQRMWVAGTASNGSAYLMEVDGDNYRPVGDAFGPGTTIRGLQVMGLTKNHGSSQYLDNDQSLLVTGNLNLPAFGNASAALFNGTDFTPLILSSLADGTPGTISRVFSSKTNNLKSNRKFSFSKWYLYL